MQSLFFLSLDLWNYCLLLICKEFRRCIYIIKVFHYSQTVASTENAVLFVTELSTTRKLFQFRYMEWNLELPNKMVTQPNHILIFWLHTEEGQSLLIHRGFRNIKLDWDWRLQLVDGVCFFCVDLVFPNYYFWD